MSGRPTSIVLSSLSNVWYNMILWLPTIVRCYSIITCPCHQTQDFSVALSNIFPHLNAPHSFIELAYPSFFSLPFFFLLSMNDASRSLVSFSLFAGRRPASFHFHFPCTRTTLTQPRSCSDSRPRPCQVSDFSFCGTRERYTFRLLV